MSENILTVNNLNVSYHHQDDRKYLIKNLSFNLERGDILGIIGETGSGKSVLIDALAKDPKPPLKIDSDNIKLHIKEKIIDIAEYSDEQMRPVWGKYIAVIPPNARECLNPIMIIGKQAVNILVNKKKITTQQARDEILATYKMVQMPAPEHNFNSYPHELSGGMAQRAVISIALAIRPTILLADEPTMGLDVTIQAQVLDLIEKMLKEIDSGLIIATRDLGIIANYCNKIAVLCSGELVELCQVKEFFENAKHPYSRYLLSAAFASRGYSDDHQLEALTSDKMEGDVCPFYQRCLERKDICGKIPAKEILFNNDHKIKCHLYSQGG